MAAERQSNVNTWLILINAKLLVILLGIVGWAINEQRHINQTVSEDHFITGQHTAQIHEHSGQIYDLNERLNDRYGPHAQANVTAQLTQ